MNKKYRYIACFIASLFGCVLIFQLIKEPVVIIRYKIFGTLIIAGILIGSYFLAKNTNKYVQYISVLTSVILAIGFITITGIVNGIGQFINVTGQEKLQNVLLVQLKKVEHVEDFSSKKIGMIYSGNDIGIYQSANTQVNGILTLVKDYEELFTLLENETVDAVFVKESDQNRVREVYKKFDYETTIVKSIAVEDIYKGLRSKDINQFPYTVYLGIFNNEYYRSIHMFLSINPVNQNVLIIRIPSEVVMIDYCGDLQQRKTIQQIGKYGVDCIMKSVSEYFDIDVNYYVHADEEAITTFVDIVDGITINNEKIKAQEEVSKALYHSQTQVPVLIEILKKLQKGTMLVNFDRLVPTFANNIKVNFTSDEITALIGNQLEKNTPWKVNSKKIEGTFLNDVFEAYQSSVEEAKDEIKKNMK